MSDTTAPIPSLADRVRPVAAGAAVVGVHFLGKTPVFVLGEEALLFAGERREARRHPCRRHPRQRRGRRAHRHRRRRRHAWSKPTRAGEHRMLAADDKKRWIDQVALGAGRRGRLVGRQDRARAHRQRRGAQPSRRPRPSPGFAFAPKGLRLAIAHYNGVTLWFPNAPGAAAEARMERLASRRHLQPGRPLSHHRHAGADAARLAPRRRPSTCACPAIRRACARSAGPRTAISSPPPAPSSSSCGRSTARTGRWAASRSCMAPSRGARFGGRLPSAPAGGGGGLCRRRGRCWCASTTAR